MGRAGGGSRGGSRSSGGRSSSRSSGRHRVSSSRSSSRAGSGGFGSRNSFGGSGFGHHGGFNPPPPHRHYGFGGYYHPPVRHTTVYHSGSGNYLTSIIVVIVILAIAFAMFSSMGGGSYDIPKSTVNREKVNTGVAFQNDCIIDELDWFDNASSASRDLQYFYNKTGVQPFVVMKAYDASLITDAQKEAYANEWYESNIDNEGTFLYMYFAEENIDDVGYMVYVNGKQITTVMDAEAVDIFWAYLDSEWYNFDLSTDEMFARVFTQTADRIMDKSTTGADIGKWAVIFIGGAVVLVLVIKVMKTKRQHDKEKNAETERILNTPLGSTATDDLVDKYTNPDVKE